MWTRLADHPSPQIPTFYVFLVSFKDCLNPLPLAPGGFFRFLITVIFNVVLRVLVHLLHREALPPRWGLLLSIVLGQGEPAGGLQLGNVVVDCRVDLVVLLCGQHS